MATIPPSRRHRWALLAMAALFLSLSTLAQGQRQARPARVIHEWLPDAVEAGDLDQVKALVEKGHDLDQVILYLHSDSSLILAIKGGHMEIFEFLIEKGADVNSPSTSGGVAPLHVAAWQGNIEACRRLIDAGADIGKSTRLGWTPLHYAARHGRLEIISLFLEAGSDVDARTAKGLTPLHLTFELTSPRVAQHLIDLGADVSIPDDEKVSIFEKACRTGSLQMVKTVASRLPPERDEHRQQILDKGLYHAFAQDSVELERFLIEQGADFDIRINERFTLLQFSAEYGLEDSVALLLEKGADVNWKTDKARWTPLHFACMNAHLGVVQMLCEHGADIDALDAMNRTPLHLAAMSVDVSVVSELVRRGADPNAQDWARNTPLDYAVSPDQGGMPRGPVHPEIAKLLVAESARKISESASEGLDDAVKALLAGVPEGEDEREARRAEVERYLKAGERSLHIAAREGSVDAAQRILAADPSELTARDRYGYLPIHLAADMGHAELVASFVNHGVPVGDQANAANWSPLHFAASRGHVDVLEALLGAGADAEARDGNGQTPLDVALYNAKSDVVALLRDRSVSR